MKPLEDFNRRTSARDGHRPECRACDNEGNRRYYAEHREERAAYKAAYYDEHREEKAAYNAAAYAAGRAPNPEQRLLASALPSWEERGLYVCYCGEPFTDDDPVTVDHIVPKSAGGTDDPWNLAPAHKRCNSAKRARPIGTFIEKLHPGVIVRLLGGGDAA